MASDFLNDNWITEEFRRIAHDAGTDLEALDADLQAEAIRSAVASSVQEVLPSFLKTLLRGSRRTYKATQKDLARLHRDISKYAEEPLYLAGLMAECAAELSGELQAELVDAGGDNAHIITVASLHHRCAMVGREVVCLVTNGFSDGALARTRVMTELAATAVIIADNGKTAADRFHAFTAIEDAKFLRLASAAGDARATARLPHAEDNCRQLLEVHGPDLKNRNGWAAPFVGKKAPSYVDLLEYAKHSKLRVYYLLASEQHHASPSGLYSTLGMFRLPGHGWTPSVSAIREPLEAMSHSLILSLSAVASVVPRFGILIAHAAFHELAGQLRAKADMLDNDVAQALYGIRESHSAASRWIAPN